MSRMIPEEEARSKHIEPIAGKPVSSSTTPTTKIRRIHEWYDDTIAPVGATVPSRVSQEQNVRKALSPFWTQSSIGPVNLLPGQDFFNLRPVTPEAAKQARNEMMQGKEEVVTAVEKVESYFSPLENVQDFFKWIWSYVTGSKTSQVGENVNFELSDEQKKHLNSIITTMKELLRQINEMAQDSDEAIKFEEMLKYMIRAREEGELESTRERMMQQFKMQKAYRKERNTEMQEQIELAKVNDIQTKFDKLTAGIQLFIATLGISSAASGVGGFIILTAAIGATIDPFLDDYLKKKLASGASWIVKGDEKTEKNTLSYLKLGLTFAALVGSLYNGLSSFLAYANMMRASSMGLQGYARNREANHDAKMKTVDFKLDKESKKFDGSMKSMEQIVKIINEWYSQLRKAKKNELKVIVDGFR